MSNKLSRFDALGWHSLGTFILVSFGSFIAAVALTSILVPYKIIDGGLVGVAIICSELTFSSWFAPIFVVINIPFVFLAYNQLGVRFLINMSVALTMFTLASSVVVANNWTVLSLEVFEAICAGGTLLGVGVGMVIRFGGCIDGTEVVALVIQQTRGISVGQTILFFNILLYLIAGCIFMDMQIAIRSMVTFVIASTVMDLIITGLSNTRAIMIISSKHDEVNNYINHTLGLGSTIVSACGGYSKMQMNIVLIIADKSSINNIKESAFKIDPRSFVFIIPVQDFHNGRIFSPHKLSL